MDAVSNPVLGMSEEEIESALAEVCCKKCFGRGFVGWTLEDDPIPCSCVEKSWKRLRELKVGTGRGNLERTS